MLKFKIPYEKKNIVRETMLPLRWNKTEKIWQCEDTLSGRYRGKELEKYTESDLSIPEKYRDRKLDNGAWDHQKKAFDVCMNYFTSYIYMIPGSGKSKVIVDLHNENEFKRTLIICPKNVIPTWSKQFGLHGRKVFVICELNKGTSEKKNEKVKAVKEAIFVINYESVWRLPQLLHIHFDCIVFDEIHRLQDSQSKVGKFCKRLKSMYKIGLTGTPGEPKKWHGQFLTLDQNLFGVSKRKFLETFFKLDYFGQPIRLKEGTSIKKDFGFLSHIADTNDIIDIPEAQHIVCDVPLGCKREYRSVEERFMLEVEEGVITVANAMVKSLKLRQVCSGFIFDEDRKIVELSDSKQKYLSEMLEDNDNNIVIFYNFKHELTQIKRAAEGRPFKVINGQRRDNIDSVQPGTILAAQIRAAGTGIDGMQDNFNYCIYYSLTWSEIDHEQSIRRLYRAGQKQNTFFYYLITKGTVEEKVYKTLKEKGKVLKEVAGV